MVSEMLRMSLRTPHAPTKFSNGPVVLGVKWQVPVLSYPHLPPELPFTKAMARVTSHRTQKCFLISTQFADPSLGRFQRPTFLQSCQHMDNTVLLIMEEMVKYRKREHGVGETAQWVNLLATQA